MVHFDSPQQKQEELQVPTRSGLCRDQKAFAEHDKGKLNLCFTTGPSDTHRSWLRSFLPSGAPQA